MCGRLALIAWFMLVNAPQMIQSMQASSKPTSQPTVPRDPKLVSETLEVYVRFPKKSGGLKSTHVTFKHEYRHKPLVLVSECGSSGRFVVVKAEGVTASGCQVTARLLDPDNQAYNARIAVVVIGRPVDQSLAWQRERLPPEFGLLILDFEKNKDIATTRLEYRHKYREPPLVLVSECDSAGTFVVLKAVKVTRTACEVTGKMVDRWDPTYRSQVAYIVLGDIDESNRTPKQESGVKRAGRSE